MIIESLLYLHKVEFLGQVATVSDGDHAKFPDNQKEEIRYLQAKDIKGYFLTNDNPVYIGREYFQQNKRSHIFEKNILLSIMGSVGDVTITPEGFQPALANRAVAIIKDIKELNPYFLFVYLITHQANLIIERIKSGAVQERINLDVLRQIKIPLLSNVFQSKIEETVKKAHAKLEESNALYAEAENLLLDELGLRDWSPSDNSISVKSFAESFNETGRLDAEYYQPKYDYALERLRNLKPKPLDIVPLETLLKEITNGGTPLRHNLSEGEIPFLTAEHIFDFRINYASEKRILSEHHYVDLQRTRLKQNDVLITIKGKVGNAVVIDNLPFETNINQDVGLFRLKNDINPYYIVGFINSIIGKTFVEQISTGQINPFLGLGNLRTLKIPIFETELMNKLGKHLKEKLNQAYSISQQSKQLLEIAKRAVELAIKETEAAAINWIDEELKAF